MPIFSRKKRGRGCFCFYIKRRKTVQKKNFIKQNGGSRLFSCSLFCLFPVIFPSFLRIWPFSGNGTCALTNRHFSVFPALLQWIFCWMLSKDIIYQKKNDNCVFLRNLFACLWMTETLTISIRVLYRLNESKYCDFFFPCLYSRPIFFSYFLY